jgi:hypothetical protein
LLAEDMRYDKGALILEYQSLRATLNNDQRGIYNEIIQAVNARDIAHKYLFWMFH